MKDGPPNPVKSAPIPLGGWFVGLIVLLAGFAYLLYRLIQSRGEWPEDAESTGLRVGELGLVGIGVLWMSGNILHLKFFAKGADEDPGDVDQISPGSK